MFATILILLIALADVILTIKEENTDSKDTLGIFKIDRIKTLEIIGLILAGVFAERVIDRIIVVILITLIGLSLGRLRGQND